MYVTTIYLVKREPLDTMWIILEMYNNVIRLDVLPVLILLLVL